MASTFLAKIISSILKMKTICSSKTSVDTQRTTRRYIPEDCTLHNHRCEKIKSYRVAIVAGKRLSPLSFLLKLERIGFDVRAVQGDVIQYGYSPASIENYSMDRINFQSIS
jgi:hypothetical protein